MEGIHFWRTQAYQSAGFLDLWWTAEKEKSSTEGIHVSEHRSPKKGHALIAKRLGAGLFGGWRPQNDGFPFGFPF